MDENNNAQFNLRDVLLLCRKTVDELNYNSIIAILRNQNDRFGKALDLIEKILPSVERVLDQDDAEVGIRAGTMFLIGLWSRISQGGSVSELNNDDWNNIIDMVLEKAVNIDPKDYSLLVFDLYKRSIAYAIVPMRDNASETVISRLEEIISLMDEYVEELESGTMTEVKFIDENLWLSLEAIFLVMTDRMSFRLIPEERRELAEAIEAFIFQKLRYSIYEKELAAIDSCLEYQKTLDQQLTEQVNAYIDALRDELDEFDALVEKAFNTKDFQEAFRGSIELAENLEAVEILNTRQDVDDYFMS